MSANEALVYQNMVTQVIQNDTSEHSGDPMEREDLVPLLNSLAYILNLKFSLMVKNLDNILHFLQKCRHLPKSCFEIFENENVRNYYKMFHEVERLLREIKDDFRSSNYLITKIDS